MSKASPDATAATATVLFVDDERALLHVYEALCGAEYEVLTAADGEQALELFGPHIDFAVLDRQLPELSGDEVVRTLRAEGYRTPVAFLSAFDPVPEPGVEYDEYLTKPVDNHRLLSVIERYTS